MQICYKAFYRLFRRLAYVAIPVDAGDFSLIDRKVVNQLKSLPETDQFLRGLRAWVGFRQTGVDYVRPERLFGKSTNNWLKNFWWARKAIFSFSFVPLEALTYSGFVLTGLSFLGLAGQVVSKILNPSIPHGVTTIIILILFFGGINILAISILGEYLGKVLEETKRRPKFIRRAVRIGSNHWVNAEEIDRFVGSRAAMPPSLTFSPQS
jgi:dolichol-phosphate mannosyltransferase